MTRHTTRYNKEAQPLKFFLMLPHQNNNKYSFSLLDLHNKSRIVIYSSSNCIKYFNHEPNLIPYGTKSDYISRG